MRADPWSFMLSSGMFISHLHVSEVVLMCKPSRKRGWEIVLPLCGRTSHGLTSWGRQRHTPLPPGSGGKPQLPKRQSCLPPSFHLYQLGTGACDVTEYPDAKTFPSHLGQATWCGGRGSKERRAGRSRSWKYKYEVEFEICFWAALSCPWVVADDNARQL